MEKNRVLNHSLTYSIIQLTVLDAPGTEAFNRAPSVLRRNPGTYTTVYHPV